MNWKVPLSDLNFNEEEKKAVLGVIESGWLAMGEVTQQFEEAFASFMGVKHAIAVTNGTASLHLACRALGIGPGDEVIVPSLTFVATANAVLYVGARPIFADITGENNLNISPESIEKHITGQTRAIMVMHYGGYPCDMRAIHDIASKHNLSIIEDAAHAPGAEIDGRKMGTWGDIASFSFFPNKNMTTGEGGMLVTDNDELAQKMRLLRSHGMTTLTWDRHKGHAWSYDVVDLGYNYRIDEIRSAIGLAQLHKLEPNNNLRHERAALYRELFKKNVPSVTLPFEDFPWKSSHHIMPVILPEEIDRNSIIQILKNHRIQTSLHYPPIHLFQYYRELGLSRPLSLPVTENLAAREITLPLYPALEPSSIEFVVDALQDALKVVTATERTRDKQTQTSSIELNN